MKKNKNKIRFFIYTLGCPKNEVDSEIISSRLLEADFVKVSNSDEADIILINSCGFIQQSKEESINIAFDFYHMKRDEQKIVMLGCLAQRYSTQMPSLMPEISGFVGADRYGDIDKILIDIYHHNKETKFWGQNSSTSLIYKWRDRDISRAEKSYTYVKIADGCSNRCSFCAIPIIKGGYRSRKIDDIVKEIERLVVAGYKEIGLVSQDLTAFGLDYGDKKALYKLLKNIEDIKREFWVRLYYLYPRRIDRDILELIANSKRILHYLDIPFQHISDRILNYMKRGHNQKFIRKLISDIREIIPDVVLRSSFIVGFPGEKREDFDELKKFLLDVQIDNAGFFEYSDEEGTMAYKIKNKLSKKTIKSRLKNAYEVQ